MRRPISMDKYLCSFKCPFCGDRVEVTAEKHEDSWSTVRGHCDSNTDKICGMEFNYGYHYWGNWKGLTFYKVGGILLTLWTTQFITKPPPLSTSTMEMEVWEWNRKLNRKSQILSRGSRTTFKDNSLTVGFVMRWQTTENVSIRCIGVRMTDGVTTKSRIIHVVLLAVVTFLKGSRRFCRFFVPPILIPTNSCG